MDITRLILEDHDEQRKMFAILDEIPRDDTAKLEAVWNRLADPARGPRRGGGAPFLSAPAEGGPARAMGESVDEESRDAIKDHNEIRDAIRKARAQQVGSDDWWASVLEARKQPTATTWPRRSAKISPTSGGMRRSSCVTISVSSSPPTRRPMPAEFRSRTTTRSSMSPSIRRQAELGPS